jgi:hypothetical protein
MRRAGVHAGMHVSANVQHAGSFTLYLPALLATTPASLAASETGLSDCVARHTTCRVVTPMNDRGRCQDRLEMSYTRQGKTCSILQGGSPPPRFPRRAWFDREGRTGAFLAGGDSLHGAGWRSVFDIVLLALCVGEVAQQAGAEVIHRIAVVHTPNPSCAVIAARDKGLSIR